ncbi:hypothetical protein BDZ90DRAFT_278615 [Jaminaea rosea]|uniref:Uncharacterized protein n=1 Tax=Jaminaea rosea TaxID=1569628 RepID=A0A316UVA9_9BASI|nr:hypothetical protein BDZ90DRAFT_278615 [Jaminaea rosea]PWN29240.1 hypothetical protein BDZ90DRAFT_278615 [Jaminaea rosea]
MARSPSRDSKSDSTDTSASDHAKDPDFDPGSIATPDESSSDNGDPSLLPAVPASSPSTVKCEEAAVACYTCWSRQQKCLIQQGSRYCETCLKAGSSPCNVDGQAPRYRRQVKTEIYKCLCAEAAKLNEGNPNPPPVPCDPRHWKEGIVGLAISFGIEHLLFDEDYEKAGLPIPPHRQRRASSAPKMAPAPSTPAKLPPPLSSVNRTSSVAASVPRYPAAAVSPSKRSVETAALLEMSSVPHSPAPFYPRLNDVKTATPKVEHDEEPPPAKRRRRSQMPPSPAPPSGISTLASSATKAARNVVPAHLHKLYRRLMEDSRMNNDGHWCPVSPVAKEWDVDGCKTIVQLAYLFGIQDLLCDKDYHDSGFPRGRASVDDAYRTHLKRLPQRLADARAKQQQRAAERPSASASGTTLRQDEDPGFGRRGLLGHTPRREREQRRQDDNGYNDNGYDDSNDIDHSFTTPEPAARTRPTSTHDANPRRAPRDNPTPVSSHTDARRPSDSRDADSAPTAAAAAASPSNRLDEYLPLFSSQIAVGDRHGRDREMSLALRFLQKEVPLVVARYNAQAAFSGKPALASYEQVVEEAIKGGRTRR